MNKNTCYVPVSFQSTSDLTVLQVKKAALAPTGHRLKQSSQEPITQEAKPVQPQGGVPLLTAADY